MPNGVHDFKEFLLPRLKATADSEASEYVLREWKTTWAGDLGEAVIDAIEHLPTRKTKLLRDWVEQAPNYSDWKALEREGWEMEKLWPDTVLAREGDRFAVVPPKGIDPFGQAVEGRDYRRAIAAGAGACEIHYVGANKRIRAGRIALVYNVISVL
jgi:hypothetical protein